jgi:hypothetical protein
MVPWTDPIRKRCNDWKWLISNIEIGMPPSPGFRPALSLTTDVLAARLEGQQLPKTRYLDIAQPIITGELLVH